VASFVTGRPFESPLDAALRVQGPPFDWFDYAHQPRAGNGEAFLPDSKKRMDARLSSLKNCHAVLQYPRKSMEGFSWVVRRYGGAR